ncbi:MAG: zf-HC2 domain-containing protein [Candidatus Omnitrophica bacterium]|nr:zf-HC2 domain-containing protein [Candidatus Omnitrophota bacterium]
MTCAKIQELLISDYIDGEADAAVKKLVEDHLTSCFSCREFLSVVQTTDDVLRQPPQERLSEDVWSAVRERITQAPLGWRERLGLVWEGPAFRPAVVFCASLAVAFFISGVIMPDQDRLSAGMGTSPQLASGNLLDDAEDAAAFADDAISPTAVEDFMDSAGTFTG